MSLPTRRRLYRHPLSGHSHRAELFLSLLGLDAELVDIDLARGEHKSPAFLAKNPFGQVPVLEDGAVLIADSAAILTYLASRYDEGGSWLPRDAEGLTAVTRWFSVAAGPLVQGPCAARLHAVFGRAVDIQEARRIARSLLSVLEAELSERAFLLGDRVTVADLALYTYTAHAPEGGVSLADYGAVRAWLRRIESLPRFVAMRRVDTAPAV